MANNNKIKEKEISKFLYIDKFLLECKYKNNQIVIDVFDKMTLQKDLLKVNRYLLNQKILNKTY